MTGTFLPACGPVRYGEAVVWERMRFQVRFSGRDACCYRISPAGTPGWHAPSSLVALFSPSGLGIHFKNLLNLPGVETYVTETVFVHQIIYLAVE